MLVRTARFGDLEVSEEAIIHFPEGLLGFEDVTRYVFVDAGDQPFRFLQAVEDENLTFVVMSPLLVEPGYRAVVTERDLRGLELEDLSAAEVYAIVTVPRDVTQMTANLRAPLVINPVTRRGRQIVLSDETYSIRHRVFPDLHVQVG